MKSKLILVSILIATSGCSTIKNAYISDPLPLPVKPKFPVVQDNGLRCLSDDVYRGLALRDYERSKYEQILETIIISTH